MAFTAAPTNLIARPTSARRKIQFRKFCFLAAAPAWIAVEIRLRSPQHQNLPIVLRRLSNETRLVAFHVRRRLHQFRIPRLAHPRRLRKLGGGDWLPPESGRTLHHIARP